MIEEAKAFNELSEEGKQVNRSVQDMFLLKNEKKYQDLVSIMIQL